jgi:hypothetical protein
MSRFPLINQAYLFFLINRLEKSVCLHFRKRDLDENIQYIIEVTADYFGTCLGEINLEWCGASKLA